MFICGHILVFSWGHRCKPVEVGTGNGALEDQYSTEPSMYQEAPKVNLCWRLLMDCGRGGHKWGATPKVRNLEVHK